jgi:hypothetical protein
MTGIMAACALAATAVFNLGRRVIVQRASLEEVEEEDVEMISTL